MGVRGRSDLDVPVPSMRCIKTILETGEGVSVACQRDRDLLFDLCDRLLDLNPAMRPSTQTILLHPFLKDVGAPSQLNQLTEMKSCDEPLLNLVMRSKDVCPVS